MHGEKMNSVKLPVVVCIIITLAGSISTTIPSNDKNAWAEESHTNQQMEDHIFYADNCIYNHSKLNQCQKKPTINYYDDEFFEKREIIQNDNITNNLAENSDKPISPLLDEGLMDSAWPMASHDVFHTGQSPYNTTGNPEGVEKWRYNCDEYVQGGPILDQNGTIYFGSFDGHLYAFNPNGTMKWGTGIGTIDSTPAIDENGIIYVGTIWWMDRLYAIYSNNGTIKWSYYDAGDDIDSSPTIGNDGTIYFGDWGGWIHALYPNGTLKWKYHTGGIITGSPAVGQDGTIYCGSHDNKLYAFYSNNGSVKWAFQTGDWVRVSPCVCDDGTVYCVSLDSYLYAIYPENGTMKWRICVGAGTNPTIGSDGTIYAGYSYLCAVRPNGTIKWVYNPGPGRSIEGSTPCTSAEGIIYFGTATGSEFIALNPNGTERWRDSYGWYESPPAIGPDGSIYVGCNVGTGTPSGCFRAFGSGEPKTIKIQHPKPGRLYLFGLDIGKTLFNNTLVIGSVKVKVNVSSADQLQSLHFYIDGTEQSTIIAPPFEWKLNHRYGKLLPLKHAITVTGYYKGGSSWSESIDVLYFHL
jgi:outer membrane protein assembly factor BamB